MTRKLDPDDRVLEELLKEGGEELDDQINELELGPREVGPGHLTQGYGFFGQSDKQLDDQFNYDTYSK